LARNQCFLPFKDEDFALILVLSILAMSMIMTLQSIVREALLTHKLTADQEQRIADLLQRRACSSQDLLALGRLTQAIIEGTVCMQEQAALSC
jgi:hypothetical protein